MTRMDEYERSKRDGIRLAITWLHARAAEMNDPHARQCLNGAAFNLGVDRARSQETASGPLAATPVDAECDDKS
ncbi:hypothetical protein [uncultured Devosia sp.]|uniref:hypothetical protein n=1 Tax=uncultured Devosia sp. TaxID=211434 RepID=UPI0035CBCA11